jgi:hypothetical protein
LLPLFPSHNIVLNGSAFPFAVAAPSRVNRIKASMGIGHSVVREQRVTAVSVKKVEGFDRFKGDFFQELGAAVTRYGEKREDGRGRGRNE